jgi:hypothetical protein
MADDKCIHSIGCPSRKTLMAKGTVPSRQNRLKEQQTLEAEKSALRRNKTVPTLLTYGIKILRFTNG